MNNLIETYVAQLKNIQTGKNWIGSNFEKKLGSMDPNLAFKRPIENIHTIAEIVAHLTTWRRETIIKIETGEGTITDDDPSNWPTNDALKSLGWEKIWSDYNEVHQALLQALQDKDNSFLEENYYDTDFKGNYAYTFVVEGMIHHDLYHLGQIGILLKLLAE